MLIKIKLNVRNAILVTLSNYYPYSILVEAQKHLPPVARVAVQ